ncbi:MAG: hypothetical protein H7Y13_07655 [Sphingobacteriaceae bacterium]|nr:hypothetical protein [Sphingobacteriaceae bacterium]
MKATLFAFFFSAAAWELFVNRLLTFKTASQILLLLKVPAYSEFLLSFFLTTGLFFLFKKQIAIITSSGRNMLVFLMAVFLIALIPFGRLFSTSVAETNFLRHYLDLLIGSDRTFFFPVVQYSSLFIIGTWFQKNHIDFSKRILLLSVLGTLAFIAHLYFFKKVPRFSPSPFWITGSFSFLYLYYLVSKRIGVNYLSSWLAVVGENSLVYLMLSNVLLFMAKGIIKWDIATALLYAGAILLFITYTVSTTRKYNYVKERHNVPDKVE